MPRSQVELYAHFVCATEGRAELVDGALGHTLHGSIRSTAEALGCEVLALDGMPDHVHMVARIAGRPAASDLAQRVKGASSRPAGVLPDGCAEFARQSGYGVFSLSRRDVPKAVAYVDGQREHHAHGTTSATLEATEEDAPNPGIEGPREAGRGQHGRDSPQQTTG